MSTLPGIAAKGEKGKSKFQSLDINNLYSKSRGESSEPNQYKNTTSRRHGGMQSLGKVPSARKPANLPSLKSEYSGNDPAISLVPSGGSGWGSKPGETGPPPTSQAPTSTTPPPITTSPPVTVTVTVAPATSVTTIPTQSHTDKSWSSITSSTSENSPMFLAHQSPYFQQQFPSLSGDGNKIDPAHLPGPSLRPQNEGNWIQGGGRPQGQMGAGVGSQQGTVPAQGPLPLSQGLDVGNSLGPSGVGGGPAGPLPSSQPFRLMPQFMIKHNMAGAGFPPPNFQHGPIRPRVPYTESRAMPPSRGPPNVEQEDVPTRPIIKEEDLKVMDEIGRDTGWAAHDEIDYNQTLSFSDEEGGTQDDGKHKTGRQALHNKEKREVERKSAEMDAGSTDSKKLNQEGARGAMISSHNEMREPQMAWQEPRPLNRPPMVGFPQAHVPSFQGVRQAEDDEVVVQEKQRIHNEELAIVVERAKQRKELEEKRFEDSRMAAQKKFKELEEKIMKEKEKKNISPVLNVHHGSNIMTPEWEKNRSRKSSEEKDDKSPKEHMDIFRNTQADNRGQNRDREGGQHSFSRQPFSSNLAPRFQRQGGDNRPSPYYRQGSGGSSSGDSRWPVTQSGSHFGGSTGSSKGFNNHKENLVSDSDKDEKIRDRERYYDSGFDSREKESKDKEKENERFQDEIWSEKKTNHLNQDDCVVDKGSNVQESKLDLPHRSESQDSRNDRMFEDNNSHDTMSRWADFSCEVDYKEEKHRKDVKDENDRRRDTNMMQPMYQKHIPGPITKEKLEASDSGRSVNLVSLSRSDNKTEAKKSENKWDMGNNNVDAWQQVTATSAQPESKVQSQTDRQENTGQPSSDVGQDIPNESQQNNEDSKKSVPKTLHNERDHYESSSGYKFEGQRGSRGGQRNMRHDSQRSKWSGYQSRGGAPMWRGDRGSMRRSNMGWGHHDPESEASDEVSVSTESGKEDRRHDQDRKNFSRSPKRGVRKSDKDDRPKDSNRKQESDRNSYGAGNDNRRYDNKQRYENNQMGAGFEPSGVPSRRGRGAFRSKGSLGRGMVDGYGPPTSKKPFSELVSSGSQEDKKSDGSQNQTINKEDGANDMSHDEKMKLNQQQLSAGIIANTSRQGKGQSQNIPRLQKKDNDRRDRRPRDDNAGRRPREAVGSGGEYEDYESTSDHEDKSGEEKRDDNSRKPYNHHGMSTRGNHQRQSSNRPFVRDKNSGSSYDKDHKMRRSSNHSMINGNTRMQGGKDQMADQSLVDKKQSRPDYKEKRNTLDNDLCNTASVVVVDDQPDVTVEEDQSVFATDNNGFQEVRSKKNVKEANRQQKEETQRGPKERSKPSKPRSSQSPGPPGSGALSSKIHGDWSGTERLAPRFVKLKEQTRQQEKHQQHDISDINKINQGNLSGFPIKDLTSPAPPPQINAWSNAKPITATLHASTPPSSSGLTDSCNVEVADHMQCTTSSQRSSPNDDKAVGKLPREPVEKAMLDGSSPPVQTIIFENTNYKTAPSDVAMKSKYSNQANKNQRADKSRDINIEEDNNKSTVGYKSTGPDMQLQETKSDAIQMPMSFSKNEDIADMKLDFRFDSELSQLTEDKTRVITSIQMKRSVQMDTQSSAAEIQLYKLASVKKVWETPPIAVMEHGGEDGNNVATASSFTPTFNSVEDPGNYGKPNDPSSVDDGSSPDNVYNSSQQLQNTSNAYNGSSVQNMIKPDPSSNVCKVKPLQQSGMHPHTGPLSPSVGPFTSSLQPSQHINYQPPPAQYSGIPAIPSPPTVYTQSHEQLYQTIQINNSQMLNSQARSQYQFPYMSQGLSQTSGFSQQSLYLTQTAPPPPTGAATPDMFQTQLSQYRIQPPTYGTSQPLNANPNAMLISSSTMKAPPQTIGAIGSKAPSYQPTSQPPSQMLIYPEHQIINQNYMQNSQLVQRPPNSVMSAIPPSSASFYSASTGGNAAAYFQPGSSNLHHLPQFTTQTPAATPAGMGSFGSFLSNGLQMAQQYRSTAPSYLKSAADHQDALSVFSSPVTQSTSPKCRSGSGKQSSISCSSQQQPSPTQTYKFTTYQQNIPTAQLMIQQQQQQQRGSVNVGCYPAPIQRPVTFQPVGRHRPQTRFKMPPPNTTASLPAGTAVHYYVTQNNSSKLVNSKLENKDESVAGEREMSSPANSTTDIAADNSTSTD